MHGTRRESNYQETEIEADDDIDGYGKGSEFDVAEVATKGYRDDINGETNDAAEYCRAHNVP